MNTRIWCKLHFKVSLKHNAQRKSFHALTSTVPLFPGCWLQYIPFQTIFITNRINQKKKYKSKLVIESKTALMLHNQRVSCGQNALPLHQSSVMLCKPIMDCCSRFISLTAPSDSSGICFPLKYFQTLRRHGMGRGVFCPKNLLDVM